VKRIGRSNLFSKSRTNYRNFGVRKQGHYLEWLKIEFKKRNVSQIENAANFEYFVKLLKVSTYSRMARDLKEDG